MSNRDNFLMSLTKPHFKPTASLEIAKGKFIINEEHLKGIPLNGVPIGELHRYMGEPPLETRGKCNIVNYLRARALEKQK